MPRILNIRKIQNRMTKSADDLDFEVTEAHLIVLGEILTEMANGRRRDAYSNYVPHLNLDRNPPNRKLISEVLGFLWAFCQEEMLPELNYLIVEKRSGYPGKYMQATWKELYGRFTMNHFERYCDVRANEAAKMIDQGLISFNTENVIRRTA